MKNKTALTLLKEIEDLVQSSKKNVFQIVDNEDSTKIVEIKEIEAFLELPAKIAYTLLKNKNKLTPVKKEQDDLIENLRKEFLEEIKLDEELYKKNKDYAKEVDEKLGNFFFKNEVLKNFMEDESTVSLYPLTISMDKVEDKSKTALPTIDPNGKFNLAYVTDLIFEHVLIFE